MRRTITIRLSVVVGVILLAAGGGFYGYGAYDTATLDREAGIDVSPVVGSGIDATDASALPRGQHALFLLAVEPGQDSHYLTTDETLREFGSQIPTHVRYNGSVYEVSNAHSDSVRGNVTQVFGILVAALGAALLLGAAATALWRRR